MSDTASASGGFLERQFRLRENGTNVRTEFIAGATTFLTMVYIVFVNPQILGNAGMDKGAVFVATCIAAAVSTLVMAFYANYPLATGVEIPEMQAAQAPSSNDSCMSDILSILKLIVPIATTAMG